MNSYNQFNHRTAFSQQRDGTERGEVTDQAIALDCSLLSTPSFGSPSPQGRTRKPHSITPCRVLFTLYRSQQLPPSPSPSNSYHPDATHRQVWSKANPPLSYQLRGSDFE
jgi:hypothetical protein